jgi:hypothetical protein
MAEEDKPKDLKKLTEATQQEMGRILETVTSIADRLIDGIEEFNDKLDESDGKMDVIGKTMKRGLIAEFKNTVKNQESLIKLQIQAEKGQLKSKDIAKERQKLEENRRLTELKIENIQKRKGELSKEEKKIQGQLLADLQGEIKAQQKQLDTIEEIGKRYALQKGLTGLIGENIKGYIDDLDKSGVLTAAFSGELFTAEGAAFAAEAGMAALATAALKGSDNINNLQKNLGISYEAAYDLQNSLAVTAATSDKLYVTSALLNKAFTDLATQTGIVSDFGGDTLVTMTALTKQLGLGTAQASQLALLARTQGEDTEGVLENTVATVSALNKQNGVAISAKAVLNDISTASKSIVVSLGMSPEILAEAATQARALGLSLSQVDAIAGSILDFESSIEKELSFELLTGKQINLEKARELALNNDLVGLTEELKNNAEITEAFATGNRIQQDAAAAAIGLSRDDLADMVYQQELIKLGAEGFTAAYGEQAYQSMLAQSASEKFEASLEKIKGVIGDIGTLFSPIIDGFAFLVGAISSSKAGLAAIAAIMGGLVAYQTVLYAKAIKTAVAEIWAGAGKGGMGWGTVALGVAGTAGLISAITAVQSVEDGIADSSRGPFTITDSYGKMAMTAKGDNLAVSPNINKGGGDDRMYTLFEKIANKDSNVYLDAQKVGGGLATSTNRI